MSINTVTESLPGTEQKPGTEPRSGPYWLALALFAGYATVSVSRHLNLKTHAYDLGIFAQAVRAYAELRAPVVPVKGPGFNLLGDHFHPILMLIAPVYRVFPSPVTLLIVQAALLALSVVPVTELAARIAGRRPGAEVGVAYGLSWGLQNAVGFDFHEVCIAVPLLAYSLKALAEQRWKPAVWWALPLLAVKEDLPLTLAAIGVYLMARRQRRLGAAVVVAAAAAGCLIVLVLIPALNPAHVYPYGDTAAVGGGSPLARLLTPEVKTHTLLMVLVPTVFLAVRSPLLLLAVPILGWRFWSTNTHYWGTGYHYSAVLMPIVFIAFGSALGSLHASRIRSAQRLAAAAPALAVVVAVALLPALPLWQLAQPATYRVSAEATAVRDVLRVIPVGATVAATNGLVPALTADRTVYLFPAYPDESVRPDWVALTDPPDTSMTSLEDMRARTGALSARGYTEVTRRAGVVLYRLPSAAGPGHRYCQTAPSVSRLGQAWARSSRMSKRRGEIRPGSGVAGRPAGFFTG
jgi:uncharacterized membrane protein